MDKRCLLAGSQHKINNLTRLWYHVKLPLTPKPNLHYSLDKTRLTEAIYGNKYYKVTMVLKNIDPAQTNPLSSNYKETQVRTLDLTLLKDTIRLRRSRVRRTSSLLSIYNSWARRMSNTSTPEYVYWTKIHVSAQ